MESRLREPADLRSCPIPAFEARPDEAQADERLLSLVRQRASTVEHDTVAEGDIVRVRLDGLSPRFRQTVSIVIGRGLFDEGLETALIGAPVGESSVIRHPDGTVTADVRQALGRVVPVPTDELVAELTAGESAGVADFRRKRLAEQREEQLRAYLDNATFEVMAELVARSRFDIRATDRDAYVAYELDRCRRIAADMGEVFDDLTADELLARVAVPSITAFTERARENSDSAIGRALLGAHYEGVDPGPLTVGELLDHGAATWQHVRAHIERAQTTAEGEEA